MTETASVVLEECPIRRSPIRGAEESTVMAPSDAKKKSCDRSRMDVRNPPPTLR